jgi:hypothetical protein
MTHQRVTNGRATGLRKLDEEFQASLLTLR